MSENITNIIISNAAPLSSTIEALTGNNWNGLDFDVIGDPKDHLFIETATGRKFKHYTVKEAKDQGITGLQMPSEATVYEFWKDAEKSGPNRALFYYLDNNLLTGDVAGSLYGGYATGSTWKEHYDLLKKNMNTSFRLSHKKGGSVDEIIVGSVVKVDDPKDPLNKATGIVESIYGEGKEKAAIVFLTTVSKSATRFSAGTTDDFRIVHLKKMKDDYEKGGIIKSIIDFFTQKVYIK